MEGDPLPCVDLIQIQAKGVVELLHNIKPSKASSPDYLPARFLKEVSSEIAPTLTLIFQASMDQGVLPEVWKQASVVPVLKKKKLFRPLRLWTDFTQLYLCLNIVYSNISKHLQRYEVLCDEQHGLCSNRGCDTQLITTVNDFAKCLDRGS